MNTKPKVSRAKSDPSNRARIWKIIWSLFVFSLGVIFGPVLQYEIFQSVPGPKATAKIQVFTNAGGCDLYSLQLSFSGDYEIDKLNFAIQLPGAIEDKRLGVSKQVRENSEFAGPFLFHGGKEACEFLTPAEPSPPNIQAATTWPNKFEFQGTDIHNPLSAEFILPKGQPGTTLSRVYPEGWYEYRLFGVPVKKRILFELESLSP